MITTAAHIRGTAQWLLAHIDPAVELAIRRQLRCLERTTSAAAVVLAVGRFPGGEATIVSFAGDRHALPRSYPIPETSLPSIIDVCTVDGDVETAVVHGVVVGRGIQGPVLLVVAPRVESAEELLSAVEHAAEEVEEVLVGAVCSPRPKFAPLRPRMAATSDTR